MGKKEGRQIGKLLVLWYSNGPSIIYKTVLDSQFFMSLKGCNGKCHDMKEIPE